MRPTVVILPGMDGAARLLSEFAKALRPIASVRLIDFPDDLALGYDELLDLVRAQLPANAQFFLLGYSFSGPIAIRLAAQRPAGLLGLILCCTFARTPQPLLTRLANLIPLALVPRRLQLTLLFGLQGKSAIRAAFDHVMAKLDTKVLKRRIAAVSVVDETRRLSDVQVPTLYLRATGDQVVPASAGKLILQTLSDCTMRAIPGPHALLHARPGEAAAEITLFIERLSAGPLSPG